MLINLTNFDIPFLMRWAGMLFLASAYILITIGALRSDSKGYPVLGALGSASVIAGSIELGAIQPIIFNGFWLTISLLSLMGITLPSLLKRERVLNFAVVLTFGISLAYFLTANDLVISVINAFAFGAITLFLGSYALYLAGHLTTYRFHLYNVLANLWMSGILIHSQNWALVTMTAFMLTAIVYGIFREHSKLRRLGLA